jgi:hypothetical protein
MSSGSQSAPVEVGGVPAIGAGLDGECLQVGRVEGAPSSRPESTVSAITVNGEPGVVFTSGGAVIQAVALGIEDGVRAVYMTNNLDKLYR